MDVTEMNDYEQTAILNDLKTGTTYTNLTEKYDLSLPEAERLVADFSDNYDILTKTKGDNRYIYLKGDPSLGEATEVNYVEETRQTSKSKQKKTREVKETVAELERKIKKARKEIGPLEPTVSKKESSSGIDVVLHRSDDHFGEKVTDERGEVIYDTSDAIKRVKRSFSRAIEVADQRPEKVDTFNLLLGGDMVTNEKVYPHQPFEIDETIDEQLHKCTATYIDEVKRLSDRFDFVQIVCQHGNHGDLQSKGTSNHANVDDMMYNQLEMLCKEAGLNNVKFIKSDSTNYTNFEMRNYRGHLRHGHNVNTHIGTSSPQATWRGFLYEYDFDIAYRGHYHNHKIEHVSGKPVIMAPAFTPCGDYEEKKGIFGKPMSYIHGVDDDSPLAWSEYITH